MQRLEKDGEVHWICRQSWFNTFMKCPEQARLDMRGELPRVVTDAMAVGTALHRGVEILLQGGEPREALVSAVKTFDEIVDGADGEFRWVQVQTRATALGYVRWGLISWATHVWPQIKNIESIEKSFLVEVGQRGNERIFLRGTWDLAADGQLWDWKTAGKDWEPWEARRYFVQPTVYCYAYFVEQGVWPTFNYVIHPKRQAITVPQVIDVQRDQGYVDWLEKQLWSMVDLYNRTDGGTSTWPLIDQSWHCSPKWCSAFKDCKGKHLGENPW